VLVAASVVLGAAACSSDAGSTAAGSTAAADPTTCSPARPVTIGSQHRTVPWDGVDRDVFVTVPPTYDGTHKAPLLLDLHGFGFTGESHAEVTGFPAAAGARGYVVVEPTGDLLLLPPRYLDEPRSADFDHKNWWNFLGSQPIRAADPGDTITGDDVGADDIGFLTHLVTMLTADLCIDPARTYVTGFSNGGGMTTTMACDRPTMFAAAGPVGGVNINHGCVGGTPTPVPVLAIHALDDSFVPYQGGDLVGLPSDAISVPDRMAQWAARNGCDPSPTTRQENQWVIVTMWTGCQATTELWSIDDWDHGWPHAQTPDGEGHIDATKVLLDFFDAHAGA